MIVIKYSKEKHKEIIKAVVHALRLGKVVAYPTDTSYGLAVDPTNAKAVRKFYRIKERTPKKPVHIVVASVAQAKEYAVWNQHVQKLAKAFWPGQISFILPTKSKKAFVTLFGAGTGTIGLRQPNQPVALDIVKVFKKPITATSANPSAHLSGGVDSYSGQQVYEQFAKQKYKPDIIIDVGKLPKNKPSTMVKVNADGTYVIFRRGPVTEKQIQAILK